MANLPEGFVLDEQADTSATSGLPEGFVVDESIKEDKFLTVPDYSPEQKEIPAPDYTIQERVVGELEDIPAGAKLSTGKVAQLAGEAYASGLRAIGLKDEADIISDNIQTTVELWGKDVAKNKAEHIEKFGSDAWNIGTTVGGFVPDVATAFAVSPKALTTVRGVVGTETILSSARHQLFTSTEVPTIEKLKAIGTDTTMALIGMKIIDSVLPSSQIEELKTIAKKEITDPEDIKALEIAYKTIEDSDIDFLDYDARERILKHIVSGNIVTAPVLSKAIKTEVNNAKIYLDNKIEDAYNTANKIGEKSVKSNYADMKRSLSLKEKEIYESLDDDGKKIWNDFKVRMMKNPDLNARDLDKFSSEFKKHQRKAEGTKIDTYGEIIGFIENKQDDLLNKSGTPGVYDEARKLYRDKINRFTKQAKGVDKEMATKLGDLIDNPSVFKVSKKLFTDNLDADSALSYRKIVKDRKNNDKIVQSVLTKGTDNYKSQEGAKTIITNYKNADKDGIKIMLGKKKAKELDRNIKALELMVDAIDLAKGADKSMFKDAMDLVSAVALYKVSPYTSARISVGATKKLLTKNAVLKADMAEWRKWLASQEKTPAIKKAIQASLIAYIATDKEED